MYKSPIEIIMEKMQMRYENAISQATQNVGINVDRDELLKALKYDRGQYEKGFDDGFAQALEIALQDAEAGR